MHANSLLASLPRKSYLELERGLAPVTLVFGDVLNEPGTKIRDVYFPSNSVVSLLTIVNGHSNTTTTWDDLKQFAEFNQDWLAWAQAGLKAGKSPQQLADEGWNVPAKYAGYPTTVANPKTPPANPPLFGGLPGRIQKLAEETKK